jgi:hypothetical protein
MVGCSYMERFRVSASPLEIRPAAKLAPSCSQLAGSGADAATTNAG